MLWKIIYILLITFTSVAHTSGPSSSSAADIHSQQEIMKAVRFSGGEAENLYLNDGEAVPEPGQKEVRIKVLATAINRADTIQRRGRYNPPPGSSDILGLEAAGIIDKLGPNCPDSLALGQRVMALLPGGGNAEFVTVHAGLLIPVPPHFSMVKAAAVPEVWLTAFQLLHFIGKLSPKDRVLIHAGASGVGTAAVQLVKQAGASSIVTAGSQEKIDFAVSLGASAGVNYKQEDVAERVLAITEGKGVNLILDCVGASMFETNMKVIALEGRLVLYGLMGGAQTNLDMAKILMKRLTIMGSTLRTRPIEYKEKLVKEFSSLALPLFDNGTFQPIIDRVLPLSDIREAHSLMESNVNKGKIILEVEKEETNKDEHNEL